MVCANPLARRRIEHDDTCRLEPRELLAKRDDGRHPELVGGGHGPSSGSAVGRARGAIASASSRPRNDRTPAYLPFAFNSSNQFSLTTSAPDSPAEVSRIIRKVLSSGVIA